MKTYRNLGVWAVGITFFVSPSVTFAEVYYPLNASNYYLPYYSTYAPSVPTGLSVTQGGANSLFVSWSPSSSNGTPIAGYYLYRNGALAAVTANTYFSDSNLSDGRYYSYTVSSYDTMNRVSAASSPVSAMASSNWSPYWPTSYPFYSQNYVFSRPVAIPVPTNWNYTNYPQQYTANVYTGYTVHTNGFVPGTSGPAW